MAILVKFSLLRTALSEFYFYILILKAIYKTFFVVTRDQQGSCGILTN